MACDLYIWSSQFCMLVRWCFNKTAWAIIVKWLPIVQLWLILTIDAFSQSVTRIDVMTSILALLFYNAQHSLFFLRFIFNRFEDREPTLHLLCGIYCSLNILTLWPQSYILLHSYTWIDKLHINFGLFRLSFLELETRMWQTDGQTDVINDVAVYRNVYMSQMVRQLGPGEVANRSM